MNFSQKENESPNIYNDLRSSFAGNNKSGSSYDNIVKSPSEILSSTSAFGSPKPGTSRVIDSLHSTIDELRAELSDVKQKYDDHKTKHGSIKKRYDQVVEQLANTKHENDMINALLERKQRRISDLEEKLSDTINSTEDYKFNLTNLEVRCKKLQESERIATSEFERMKIAYETVVTSQKEYRDYYSKEINSLKDKLNAYIKERSEKLISTQNQIKTNDRSISADMKKLTTQSHNLEQQYAAKNTAVVDTLKSLALAAKSHGLDTQLIINQCNLVFNELKVRFDLDVKKLIDNYKDKQVDNTIEKLLGIDTPAANYSATFASNQPQQQLEQQPQPQQQQQTQQQQQQQTSKSAISTPTPNNYAANNNTINNQKKRNSNRKSSTQFAKPQNSGINQTCNSSPGSIKEQENIDPNAKTNKKLENKRSVSASVNKNNNNNNGNAANNNKNKRHSRTVSLTKNFGDFSEFEKGNKNPRQSKRNSLYGSPQIDADSGDFMSQDWRSSKPNGNNNNNAINKGAISSPNAQNLDEEDENDEGSDNDVSDDNEGGNVQGTDAGKKKKRRRRRKRKSQKHNVGDDNDVKLDEINDIIQNDLSITSNQ